VGLRIAVRCPFTGARAAVVRDDGYTPLSCSTEVIYVGIYVLPRRAAGNPQGPGTCPVRDSRQVPAQPWRLWYDGLLHWCELLVTLQFLTKGRVRTFIQRHRRVFLIDVNLCVLYAAFAAYFVFSTREIIEEIAHHVHPYDLQAFGCVNHATYQVTQQKLSQLTVLDMVDSLLDRVGTKKPSALTIERCLR
jgi:hypothetical protein